MAVTKLELGPSAYAVLRIRGDVRRIERAEDRLERHAASKPGFVLLVGRRMAGRTSARIEHGAAILDIRRMRGERVCRNARWNGDDPERGGPEEPRLRAARAETCALPDRPVSYRSRINERGDALQAHGTASCRPLAIGLMATAAVLAQLTELSLEAFEVLRCL